MKEGFNMTFDEFSEIMDNLAKKHKLFDYSDYKVIGKEFNDLINEEIEKDTEAEWISTNDKLPPEPPQPLKE